MYFICQREGVGERKGRERKGREGNGAAASIRELYSVFVARGGRGVRSLSVSCRDLWGVGVGDRWMWMDGFEWFDWL